MAKTCGWWICSHPVDRHTETDGCAEPVRGRQCVCYLTPRGAARYRDHGGQAAAAWRGLLETATSTDALEPAGC